MPSPSHIPRRRRRPPWHKPLGVVVVAVCLAVIVVNDLVLLGVPTPLPGGHSEGYLFAAMGAGSMGAWLTGVLDTRRG